MLITVFVHKFFLILSYIECCLWIKNISQLKVLEINLDLLLSKC